MWLPPEQIMLCVIILNKQKCHYFLSVMNSKNTGAEQVLPGEWYRWEGGGGGERV
jgi:hypothetical protein